MAVKEGGLWGYDNLFKTDTYFSPLRGIPGAGFGSKGDSMVWMAFMQILIFPEEKKVNKAIEILRSHQEPAWKGIW
ncbi:hypothetical protein JMG10_01480 [Nostoc ellipsosporum NOK]|nr:hypothetical protein [Nostoc ellipsosporum NOK]